MRRLVLLFTLVGSACATTAQYQGVTASHIGCPPEEIAITDTSMSSWTAVCRGQRYFCSVVAGKERTVTCAAETAAQPVPAVAQ